MGSPCTASPRRGPVSSTATASSTTSRGPTSSGRRPPPAPARDPRVPIPRPTSPPTSDVRNGQGSALWQRPSCARRSTGTLVDRPRAGGAGTAGSWRGPPAAVLRALLGDPDHRDALRAQLRGGDDR